ncbi:MAG: BBP7 family outer membrane beta-barrel protein [Pirellulales bacterium]|nr:BBP7 family outer membrane beta-barrel protein [Pirellulales bacterium]
MYPDLMPPDRYQETGCTMMPGIENGLWDGCDAGDCCCVCGGGYCTPPLWYTEQGARLLTRSRPRPQSLGNIVFPYYNTLSDGSTVFGGLSYLELDNTRSASYDVAPGYYATVGRYLGRDSQDRDDFLEFTYWGMNTWVDSFAVAVDPEVVQIPIGDQTAVFTAGRIVTPLVISQWALYSANRTVPAHPFGVGGFDFVERQNFSLHSEMHNWELNLRLRPRGRPDQLVLHPNGRWRRECQPSAIMSYLVGLRYMTVGDGFLYHSEGTVVVNDQSYLTSADYNVQTQNDLFGLQFGAEMLFRRCKWNWAIRSKVGAYVNFSDCKQYIANQVTEGYPLSDVRFNEDLRARRQQAAFIGEVGFSASYKFKPNLTGRAAYDFMWITGIALAPEQVEWVYVPVARDNANGNIYAHGVTLELEWSW